MKCANSPRNFCELAQLAQREELCPHHPAPINPPLGGGIGAWVRCAGGTARRLERQKPRTSATCANSCANWGERSAIGATGLGPRAGQKCANYPISQNELAQIGAIGATEANSMTKSLLMSP